MKLSLNFFPLVLCMMRLVLGSNIRTDEVESCSYKKKCVRLKDNLEKKFPQLKDLKDFIETVYGNMAGSDGFKEALEKSKSKNSLEVRLKMLHIAHSELVMLKLNMSDNNSKLFQRLPEPDITIVDDLSRFTVNAYNMFHYKWPNETTNSEEKRREIKKCIFNNISLLKDVNGALIGLRFIIPAYKKEDLERIAEITEIKNKSKTTISKLQSCNKSILNKLYSYRFGAFLFSFFFGMFSSYREYDPNNSTYENFFGGIWSSYKYFNVFTFYILIVALIAKGFLYLCEKSSNLFNVTKKKKILYKEE
ncbi:putative SP-containing membrane protein [Vairimorpha necatrix]|uniref:SP-containing membrane protein n=1 Tax=Vairimorpha necatrix TaxID=6039 RepID=A0AAX4JCC6_9MICR